MNTHGIDERAGDERPRAHRGGEVNDLDAIETLWLQMCPSCDAGLPYGCTHPDLDYRPVMAALVEEIRRLREAGAE